MRDTGYTTWPLPVAEDMALRVREFSVVAEMLLFSGQYLDIVPGNSELKDALEIFGNAELGGWEDLAVSIGHQQVDLS